MNYTDQEEELAEEGALNVIDCEQNMQLIIAVRKKMLNPWELIIIFAYILVIQVHSQSNSANNRLTNLSIVIGFCTKHPKLTLGYTSLRA